MKSLKELQRIWYKKLADAGFEDIENTELPDRPLKQYDSFYYARERLRHEMDSHQPYQQRIEDFYNGEQFPVVCKMLAARKNSLTQAQIKQVWELHIEGRPMRAIAKEMGITLSRVNYLIGRLRAWMNLS